MKELIVPRLLLDTKQPIPFPQAQLTIYQPSVAEISLINESDFFVSVNAISKDYKKYQDNFDLSNMTNFDILMSIIFEKAEVSAKIKEMVLKLLFLLFPQYNINFTPRAIVFQNQNDKNQIKMIDNSNFDIFSQIIFEMFALAEMSGEETGEYNPQGDRARALVEKFKKKRELLAKLRQERGEDSPMFSVFGRYINVLAVGECKDKNILAQYSVYQLIEEFKRFQLKEAFDYTFQAKMAGATKIKDAKDWTGEIQFGHNNTTED